MAEAEELELAQQLQQRQERQQQGGPEQEQEEASGSGTDASSSSEDDFDGADGATTAAAMAAPTDDDGGGADEEAPTSPPQTPLGDKIEQELRALFGRVDSDGSGFIDREELSELGKQLGKKLKKKQLDAAMKELDPDGDEMISFEEFAAWWRANGSGTGGLFGGLFKKILWKKSATVAPAPQYSPGGTQLPAVAAAAPKPLSFLKSASVKLVSSGSFRDMGRLRSDSYRSDGTTSARSGATSPSYARGGSGGALGLNALGDQMAEALRDSAALQQQMAEHEAGLATLSKRLEAVEKQTTGNAKGIKSAGEELQQWTQENGVSGVAALQRRLAKAEMQWQATAASNKEAVTETAAAIAGMQGAVVETLTGLSGAIRQKRCVHCSCIFTDGANTSHSCVYHPGERDSDNRWTCCRRHCGSGGRLVDGCLADFHRHMERATIRTPGLIPWSTAPRQKGLIAASVEP